jgi:hypothetical protein
MQPVSHNYTIIHIGSTLNFEHRKSDPNVNFVLLENENSDNEMKIQTMYSTSMIIKTNDYKDDYSRTKKKKRCMTIIYMFSRLSLVSWLPFFPFFKFLLNNFTQ